LQRPIAKEHPLSDLFWVNKLREQVKADIQALLCNGGEEGKDAELVGLLPVQDRLDDLRKRLMRIETLISEQQKAP
jgi:hypothetical protein